MMRSLLPALVAGLVWVCGTPAFAQSQIPGLNTSKQFTIERLGETHWKLTGEVELEKDDMRFFADEVDYYTDTETVFARGNVVYASRDNRIAADRMEFNTRTRTGVFYEASGTASLGDRVDKSFFGTQEPDAYFYGDTIEKIGPEKYRITGGGFTTCVQPTPRWEISASTVVLTLEKYAVVRNSVLKVKGVPLFYMPVFYYPVQKDDRATGFLIPAYGTSTIRGQSVSNAFFWAISRSQDATFFHDWFSRTGQGMGGEYRYIAAPGSEGWARTYYLSERAATYVDNAGNENTSPERTSYEVRANVVQRLPANLRARANVDYFSDVTVQQTYHGNLYDASRRQRSYGGNVAGTWGANGLSATYTLSEIFFGDTDSTVYGNAPRLSYNRAARQLGSLPVYFSAGADFVRLVRTSKTADREFIQGLSRFDMSPQVRVPLTRWPFLTVNSSITWRGTYYSESLDETNTRLPESLFRRFWDLRSEVVGPVFNRIWDTPTNGYADKFKHVIEPSFSVQRVTAIEEYDRIVKLESVDYTVGGMTRLNYGLTNRFLAKQRSTGQAREFLNVSVSQTYYTDELASRFDPGYGTSFLRDEPSNFSPLLLSVRGMPTDEINGSVRLEYDQEIGDIVSLRANGTVAVRDEVHVTAGWSQRKLDETRKDNYLNVGTTVRLLNGRIGGSYGFDYDFLRDKLLQQRVTASYNAQCCGIVFEYQSYDFPRFDPRFAVPRDRRINIGFTLAGVGTFSNLFGAFGGNTETNRR